MLKLRLRLYLSLCVVAALLLSPTLSAQESPEPTPQSPETQLLNAPPADTPSALDKPVSKPFSKPITPRATPKVGSGAFFAQVMIGLVFVLACIFALSWLVKRMGQGGFLANNQMKVVSSLAVGTRERVLVVDVGGKQILLGITPQNINSLHVFDEPVIHTEEGSLKETAVGDFSEKIKYFMQKGSK